MARPSGGTGDVVIADAAVEVEGQDLLGGEERGDPCVPVIAEVEEAEADAGGVGPVKDGVGA